MNKRIVTVLNDVFRCDEEWTLNTLEDLVGKVKDAIKCEENAFGLYKLIYCVVTGEVVNNKAFFNKLFGKSMNEGRVADMNIKRISKLSLIHICRCRRIERCRSRWSPYH
eukprot:TRINITY_DN18960_c0_g1_i1.p1 TRINITY_DN18960_c0_g1~~TRINITY_DN18960_c0_g1_i1.p1  ORF type:complete len:110 (+),score=31.67 TRINITY_DN18960_c0_g1_i1:119-448(+)